VTVAGTIARVPVAEGVEVIRDLRIPMRDGIRLAADLYLPAAADADLPVVVDYIPYRKDEVDITVFRHYLALARHGYGVCRIDIRGTGGSEGRAVDEYVLTEQLDGYDAVEWIAAQPWSDGHVNLMGISYGGFTALQVATHQPPHLTSIIPIDATDDRYTDDCHYRGGLLRMYYDVGWYGTRMVAWNAMPPGQSAALSPAARAATWREHIEHDEPYLLHWLTHQTDGPYWRQGSVAGSLDRITCPTFIIGGWRDGYPNPPLRLFDDITGPKKVLIGPWDHAMPDGAIPGPRIDYLSEIVRWLDHWCRGIDTGVMDEAPITVFVQEAGSLDPTRLDTPGRWRREWTWPVPAAEARTFYLDGDGALSHEAGAPGRDQLAYDPTVGTAGGLWSGGVPFGLTVDQRPDEGRSLVYTSAPLASPVTILGRARAVLHVSTAAPVVGLAVSLSDVDEDGRSHLVAKGMTTVRGPEPRGEIALEIDATAWRFRAAHRIRVAIASADWPNVWPTPHPATITVRHGTDADTRIELPVVPDEGSAPAPVFEPSLVDVRAPHAREPRPTWTVENDMGTDRTTTTIRSQAAFRTLAGAWIERDFGCACEVDRADPAHATARGWHRCRSTTEAGWAEAQADVEIRSDVDTFTVAIDLEVRVDGNIHATRRWDATIPRAVR
jgi:uncharacterized protein